ncbi:hypothetical protein H5410_061486 [Solanum commersonii]|uniref:Uncharacterized protein n=1 Tax=Solanum commersonii TaxID=4109 RepID=A0A9J5W9A9_SOLCO|nr:hypothetical protein H5410_061486 [Solanum commersonii]
MQRSHSQRITQRMLSPIVVKYCAAKEHSAQLVGIADALGDLPFGLLHRLSASSHFGSLGNIVLPRKTVRQHADCSFSSAT